MKNSELVENIAKSLSLEPTMVKEVIEKLGEVIIENICDDDIVNVSSLGYFALNDESLMKSDVSAFEFKCHDAIEQQIRTKSGKSSVIYKGESGIGIKCKKTQRPCPTNVQT